MNKDKGPPTPDGQSVDTQEIRQSMRRVRLVTLTGPQAGRVYPFDRDVVVGRDVDVDIRIDALDVSRRHARVARDPASGAWYVEDLKSSNGTSVNGMPLRSRQPLTFGDRIQVGTNVMLVFTHHDVLEEQVQQLQKLESLGQLTGEMAHAFKNLLTVLTMDAAGMAAAVRDGEVHAADPVDQGRLLERVDRMERTVKRANEEVARLLSVSRKGKGDEVPTNMSSVANDVLSLARDTFPDSIRLEQHIEPYLFVLGDPSKFHHALLNLLMNARDAMPRGGSLIVTVRRLSLDLSDTQLQVPLAAAGDYVMVEVADTGTGMDEETRGRVFEPFFTTKPRGQGTGLGLATVYAAVTNHGGHIQLDSWLGQGTTFRLFFPQIATTDTPGTTLPLTAVPRRRPAPAPGETPPEALRKRPESTVSSYRRPHNDEEDEA